MIILNDLTQSWWTLIIASYSPTVIWSVSIRKIETRIINRQQLKPPLADKILSYPPVSVCSCDLRMKASFRGHNIKWCHDLKIIADSRIGFGTFLSLTAFTLSSNMSNQQSGQPQQQQSSGGGFLSEAEQMMQGSGQNTQGGQQPAQGQNTSGGNNSGIAGMENKYINEGLDAVGVVRIVLPSIYIIFTTDLWLSLILAPRNGRSSRLIYRQRSQPVYLRYELEYQLNQVLWQTRS